MSESTLTLEESSAPWAEPWMACPDAAENPATRELQRECPVSHVLYRLPVLLIARRGDCDDFLFRLTDGTNRYAVVHLTWNVETDPKWPRTEIFASFDDFVANRLRTDVADWNL